MTEMKKIVIILLIGLFVIYTSQAALLNEEAQTAAGQVMVTNVTLNPAILMMGDTATLAITFKNTGQVAVPISTARLRSDSLRVVNYQTYSSVGTLGAGNTMTCTFTIEADARDNIYYLWFYLDFRDAGGLSKHIPITVESTPVMVSVIDAPEIFETGAKQKISVLVANPRDNEVSGVTAYLKGEGIQTTQSAGFIGTLAPGASRQVDFDLTADHDTTLSCITTYRNGINEHVSETSIPIKTGEGKIRAEIIVNNIKISSGGGRYTLTADLTNAGLDQAYAIVTTVRDPAVPTDPYRSYIVGSLEPDDFSSFELTFQSREDSVPIHIRYKDKYGNDYETGVTISLNDIPGGGEYPGERAKTASGNPVIASDGAGAGTRGGGQGFMGSFGSGLFTIPIQEIGAGIVILFLIAGGILLLRRARSKRALQRRLSERSE